MGCAPSTNNGANNNGDNCNRYIEFQDRSNNNSNSTISTDNNKNKNKNQNQKGGSFSKKKKNHFRAHQQQQQPQHLHQPRLETTGKTKSISQSSMNSLTSSEQTNQPKDDDIDNNDYSCGLFNFSIDFCHQCHQPRQTSSSRTPNDGRKHKNKNKHRTLLGGKSSYHKQISASLTGLHSLVDQESSNHNLDERVQLYSDNCSINGNTALNDTKTSAILATQTIVDIGVPITTMSNKTSASCSNVYSHGIGGFGDKQAISKLGFANNSNVKNNELIIVHSNDSSSQKYFKSSTPLTYSYCKLCIKESFRNFSDKLNAKKDKDDPQTKQRSQILDQIVESKNPISDGDSSKTSDNNDNKHPITACSLSSLHSHGRQNQQQNQRHQFNHNHQPQSQYCCRHGHLLEPKKSFHHPNCCLHIQINPLSAMVDTTDGLTATMDATTLANNFFDSAQDSASISSTKTDNVSHQASVFDQTTVNRRLSNQDIPSSLNNDQNTAKSIANCQNISSSEDQSCIRFGRMNIETRKPKLLLVFIDKHDSQSNTLGLAGERAGYVVTMTDSAEVAMNAYVEMQHELIIIDSRHSSSLYSSSPSSSSSSSQPSSSTKKKRTLCDVEQCSSNDEHKRIFRPDDLCKSIRNVKGSEFTTIIAMVKLNFIEENESAISTILSSGFNRFLIETNHSNYYINELIQLREFELNMQAKLKASNALFTALDSCKDGVVITGPNHDIRYANHSIEKMFGFRLEDMIGQKAQEFFQTDLLKDDVDEKINNYNDGKEWEGSIYHRRKSGESVPIWNRILPMNCHKGLPEYIIYIKEFPFYFIEKLMNPEKEFSSSIHGSIKGYRKVSVADGRRPSLAKFNSVSMIEAPITRVINMLMAIKEKAPSFLAPTLDKAIDILKNSEVFTPQLQRPDDQITSELVCSLINTNKTSRRMSTQIPNETQRSSLLHLTQTLSTPPNYSHSTTGPVIVPPEIKKMLEDDLRWDFDVIELERISCKSPLVWLGLSILNRFNVCETLKCNETTVRKWLTVIESNYRNNPYHNSTHAADVLQATAYFLMSERLLKLFDHLDQAICLIAAIIHDVDHPGRNSAFLANSNHDLAILYNDISVLESHHAAFAFRLTIGPNSDHINILKNLDRETYREARQSIIDMVLATEMTKHFEHLSKFVNTFQDYNIVDNDTLMHLGQSQSNETLDLDQTTSSAAESQENLSISQSISDLATPENIVLIKRMLIKCADVSNPGRPTKLCESWAHRIALEYCDQTEEEKRRCLPVVMPTFDRSNCSIPKSQIGFIDYFAHDMFEAWHSFGDFPEMIKNMNTNYQYWSEQLAKTESMQSKFPSAEIREVDEEE